MTTQQELAQWLHEGIQAAKAGQLEMARFRLLDVVEQDQTNEAAWYWLYRVFSTNPDKRICLENLLIINPRNQWAKDELARLNPPSPAAAKTPPKSFPKTVKPAGKPRPTKPKPRPLTIKLVTAFWFGVSAVLLIGGVLGGIEWFISTARTRAFSNYITATQALELLVATAFVIAGIIGLIIASLLLSRSIIGFLGSIILALALLLVGPTVSLITDPPNYLTMTCTGGIAGMIVLLTLAGQAGLHSAANAEIQQ